MLKIKRKPAIPHSRSLNRTLDLTEHLPTDEILKNQRRIWGSMNFRDDLDNDEEDSCSDENEV